MSNVSLVQPQELKKDRVEISPFLRVLALGRLQGSGAPPLCSQDGPTKSDDEPLEDRDAAP